MTDDTRHAIVCAACGGDPRASAQCRACGGAGIGVPSPDGFLVWTEPVDAFHIRFRRFRRHARVTFHLLLVILILVSWAVLIVDIAGQPSILDVLDPSFWFAGRWQVIAFGAGLFLTGFLTFRLREYAHEETPIPVWGLSRRARAAYDAASGARANHRFDVSPYYAQEARDIVDNAWNITRDLKRTQVTPEMLFAAVLTSPTGGILMARLGMDFEKVKTDVANIMAASAPAGDPPILFERGAKRVLAEAYADARGAGRPFVGPTEIFLRSFAASEPLRELLDRHGFPPEHVAAVGQWIRLQQKMREDYRRFAKEAALKPKQGMNRAMTARQAPLMDAFSDDVTAAAAAGRLFPLVGRDRELEAVFRAFESGRNAIVLVGEAGAGKTAIVDGMARRMAEEDVPDALFDKRLVSVHVPELLAGAGEPANETLVAMLNEVRAAKNIVLVLEGMEALVGTSSGPMDLAEILAAEFARGGLRVIGTATPTAWTEHLERRTIGSVFAVVRVQPLEQEPALRVCMAQAGAIEYEHKIFFSYAALQHAVRLSARYLHDTASPQNALDVLRETAASVRKARGEGAVVSGEDVAAVVHAKTDIPVEAVSEREKEKLLSMEANLHRRIIGQDEAVSAVSQALRRSRAEIREGSRPIASFLFLGPTGVGKTALAKALAAEYFGDESMMIRVDMSEYQAPDSVARMIGFPGSPSGGLVSEAVRKRPFSLMLLDEAEKAHPDILNLFLQVMEDGRLTDGAGRTVDFTNVIIIMTSNAGTPFIQAETAKGTPLSAVKTALLERELRRDFRPEFLNRFDGVIVFAPLSMQDMAAIARLQLAEIGSRLAAKGIRFRAEDAAVAGVAEDGYDPLFGARPLKRLLQERVENPLADLILKQDVTRGDTVVLDEGGNIRLERHER